MSQQKRDKLLFYKKVQAVQAIYLAHKREEVTNIGIFRKYVQQQFYIKSERQFYRYLAIRPQFLKAEIARLEALAEQKKEAKKAPTTI